MHNIKVNNQFEFKITQDQEGNSLVNGTPINIDFSQLSDGHAHILYKQQSYSTELVAIDRVDKTCKIKVNGNIYQLNISDQYDELLQQLGLDNLTANKVADIKAPMPGLVLNVLVTEGGEVKKGDNLLVLEAMKMENILKSPTDGSIKKIKITKGDKVEKNQILIQFK